MKRTDFRRIKHEYFSFSSDERRGLVVLIFLMVLVFIADKLIFRLEKPGKANEELFYSMLGQIEGKASQKTQSLFIFDPNTIDSLALDSLILPLQVKRNMLRYRHAGGYFKEPDDLRKIYGMTDSVFAVIAGYIHIPVIRSENIVQEKTIRGQTKSDKAEEQKQIKDEIKPDTIRIELNGATSEGLLKLYGIGPVLSGRIVKYRDLLGGFYSVEQLKEVYGLDPETFESLKNKVTVNTSVIIKLNVNFAEVGDLMRHPYLGSENAKRIVSYRSKTGFIEDINALKRDSVLSPEGFDKVRPYLKSQ